MVELLLNSFLEQVHWESLNQIYAVRTHLDPPRRPDILVWSSMFTYSGSVNSTTIVSNYKVLFLLSFLGRLKQTISHCGKLRWRGHSMSSFWAIYRLSSLTTVTTTSGSAIIRPFKPLMLKSPVSDHQRLYDRPERELCFSKNVKY